PIHKGGPFKKPENYRAVMLINCLCKIFMNILTIRLSTWAEENAVIEESQAGFRKQYSTIDNIFSLQALVQKYLCRPRGRFYCIFVDFKRAFDSIQHANLWLSLERKGISENSKFLKIFKSMYSQLKSCVKVKDGLTRYFECYIGTRQGCVSSPIIFSLFINDLISYLRSQCDRGIFVSNQIEDLLALMFADDVASFSDSIIGLQRQINCIQRFCNSVGMSLNLLKTKIIVFRNGGIVKNIEHWFYEGIHIDIVPFYKYLGVYFTPKLVWTKTKEVLAHQASKAVNRIFHFQSQFGFFRPKDIFKLFDAIVSPILCYGSEVWGYEYSKTIEKIHIKFCKRFIGLHQNTADFFALSECGRYPISITYMCKCVKYWAKILQMSDNRYPRQCYTMLRSLSEAGKTTWASQVRTLLHKYGFGYIWEANTVGDINIFVKVFKQRLKDCCLQEWHSDTNESPKSIYYCKFKLILEVETYLNLDLPYLYRKALANFRCSSQSLMIETGRHQRIDRNMRFCPLCLKRNVYTVEDEFHFFCICPSYQDIRFLYFEPRWITDIINANKFISIMSNVNKKSI
ncbi:MAG: reverse transcriptase family protein, partial [Candidatus Thiodiazotropha endolucinida]|nr:reverse transcriptase family protein [Candidatus Thiodiazotropha taylori]MCW4273446.1 reverse transcriptase family protein [Candidatus Thiodiazotropha endolucinida]